MKLLRFWRVYGAVKPPKLEVLRIIRKIAEYAELEGLPPPQNLQNRRFCVAFKIYIVMFNTPKSEVILFYTKTPKSECLCV